LNKTPEEIVLEYVQTKNPLLRESVLISYKPLIKYIARKLAFNKNDVDDLIQIGSIAILKSLERFDPGMETDFSTFATPNIIGEIKHYFRDKSRLVKVPRKLQELYSKIKNEIRECQKRGISPTINELAITIGVSEEKILESMEAGQSFRVLSLDSPSYKHDSFKSDSGAGPTLLDTIGVDGKEDALLNREALKQAITKLSNRDKRIIYLRFYCGLSQMEIAERLELSQMHISRLLKQSIDNLRKLITTP
jgi:RNA polymerase sigma-B factor